jgi:protein-tyrosine phosphatase
MNERRIALTGAVNFRDIGGYPGADGRSVRWRTLLRADSLADLSDADHSALAGLGLNSLFDLRHPDESRQRPNRLPPKTLIRSHAIGFYPHGAEAMMIGLRGRSLSKAAARDAMLTLYRHLPVDNAPVYAHLLRTLLVPNALPALIHCTSGKDRTGFGIAVLLLALGVTRETVLDDYLLTNHYRRDLSFMLGTQVDAEVLDVVKAADPEFLLAAFDVIDLTWGGTAGFLSRGLGLSETQQTQLQDLLLEPTAAPLTPR